MFTRFRSLLVLSVALPTVCVAALPPVSPAHLHSQAEVVLAVQIEKLSTTEEARKDADFVDLKYLFTARTLAVLKGPSDMPAEVKLATWTALKRPDGWAGPGGLRGLPKVGERVVIFGSGRPISIHQPNGVARLERLSGALSRADHQLWLKTKTGSVKLEESQVVPIGELEALLGQQIVVEAARMAPPQSARQPTKASILDSVGRAKRVDARLTAPQFMVIDAQPATP